MNWIRRKLAKWLGRERVVVQQDWIVRISCADEELESRMIKALAREMATNGQVPRA